MKSSFRGGVLLGIDYRHGDRVRLVREIPYGFCGTLMIGSEFIVDYQDDDFIVTEEGELFNPEDIEKIEQI
jgi:hypothetical protein